MIKSIKSRWFVLKPERLAYYVSQGYREKKGEIVLNNEAKVVGIPDKGSNKCRFMVTCGQTKKDYEQTAPDQRTKQAWMTAIQTTIGMSCIFSIQLKKPSDLRLVKHSKAQLWEYCSRLVMKAKLLFNL